MIILMRTAFFSLILLTFFVQPMVAHADPLCSDGSIAPGGNICNCASAASIGGSNFSPGTGSGLTGNSYNGLRFSGVGGALASCLNIGGAISDAAQSLLGSSGSGGGSGGGGSTPGGSSGGSAGAQGGGSSSVGAGSSVPTGDKDTQTNTKNTAAEEKKTTKREQCLNGAADAVAKTALQKLSDKTLNWVKTGFNGNPFYVRDIDSYLTSIKNEKLDGYLNQYVQSSNPIFGNALRSVLKQQATGYSDGLLTKVMNTPQGKAYQDFQGDFTKGGWDALLNPQNNPVGAYFNATDQLGTIVNTAQQNVKEELVQGNGFLSMKKCAEYEQIKVAGAPICNDNGIPIDELPPGTTCSSGTSPAPASIGAGAPKCLRYETVTPGALISSQVSQVTGSTVRQLENTTKINQVLGTFFDQLMNRLLADGLTGSGKGSNTATTGGGIGTNVVTGTNGQTLASATTCQTPLGYDATTGGFNQEFDISRPQQLRAVIVTQKNYLTRSQDAQYIMQSLVPRLGALDYCMPGPNPTWNNNLNQNAETFVSQLQEIRNTDNNILVTLNHVLDPSGILCSIFSSSSNCSNEEYTVGYVTSRVSLFDKVDYNTKRITDRVYETGVSPGVVASFFSDAFDFLKSKYATTYSETAITNAFLSAASNPTPADTALITGDVKASIKETGNLLGYAQGVVAYNEQYNTSIKTTQDAITELTAIDTEVESLVATAKARYINDHNQPGQTPIKLSCIDNAYQIGPIPAGLTHLENLGGTPDPFIQTSLDSSKYFYSHL